MSLRTVLLAAAAVVLAPLPAMAQDPEQPLGKAPIEMVAQLAEVLGRAHAVRTVCNGDTDSTWRNYMLNLMAMEAPSGSRRAALTDAFNRGYRGQNRETATCTAQMPRIEAGIARRGRELADAIAKSYLN